MRPLGRAEGSSKREEKDSTGSADTPYVWPDGWFLDSFTSISSLQQRNAAFHRAFAL